MKYQAVIVKGPSNYGAMVPDLPGVYAVGETANETRERIAGAIDLHIRGLIADGEPVPQPSVAELVEVTIPLNNKKPTQPPEAPEPPGTSWPPPRPTAAAMIEDLSKTDPVRWIRRF